MCSRDEHLRIVGDTVDRRVWLRGRLDNCDPTDTKNVVRLSTEIRQCDGLPGAQPWRTCTSNDGEVRRL